MRLFISINIPQELHKYCRQLQSKFPDMKNTDEFHITIQFLGDDTKSPTQIINTLKNIHFLPFNIEMGDAIPFPNVFNPRGVWIECRINPELKKLAEEIRGIMEKSGYVSDKPFKAHITLGRYKYPPKQKIQKIKGESNKFTVNQFHLVESILTPAGPKHKIIFSFPNQ